MLIATGSKRTSWKRYLKALGAPEVGVVSTAQLLIYSNNETDIQSTKKNQKKLETKTKMFLVKKKTNICSVAIIFLVISKLLACVIHFLGNKKSKQQFREK